MDKTKAKTLHAGKTLRRAGATPLLTAFSRPKLFGVAPARHARKRDRVLPACIQRCKQARMQEQTILNTRRRKLRWHC